MANEIESLEDFLKNSTKKPKQKQIKQQTVIETPLRKEIKKKFLESDIGKLPNIGDSLTKNSKLKLEYYLKKTPKFTVLSEQLELLVVEFNTYKKIGDKENQLKTSELIKEVQKLKQKFTGKLKPRNVVKDKSVFAEKVEKSEKLKQLKDERKQLEAEYAKLNPNSLFKKLKYLRNSIKFLNIESNDIDDIDVLLSSNESQTQTEYSKLIMHIAGIIDELPSIVDSMTEGKILTELKASADMSAIEKIKNKLSEVKIDAASELNKLNGNEDITEIIFETFDFETDQESEPKEMLAVSNIGYTKSIAYNICNSMNMLHHLDDAVAYGLIGLTVAINKWYEIQKMKDSVITFSGFSNRYIANNIKKGLYELGSGGMINKDSMADMVHKRAKRKKEIESYVLNNPEFKDLPSDMLDSIVETLDTDYKVAPVITEGTYSDIVGGEEAGADIWTNASPDLTSQKLIEAKFEYEHLIKSIKSLFNLFEIKENKETGLAEYTNKKMFNKYDYKLFKMMFGMEFKREKIAGGTEKMDNNYSQAERGEQLSAYYAANGVTKTFTQSSMSDREATLIKKLKKIMDYKPEIKAGFEYLYTYCQANQTAISYLSNNREEIGMESERQTLKDIYGNTDELNKQLSDSSTLSDIFTKSQQNILDDEIAEAFAEFN